MAENASGVTTAGGIATVTVWWARNRVMALGYHRIGGAPMKIKALDTYFLSATLPQPVRTSTSTISRVSELVVKLTTDPGLVGIGEAHGPFLSQGGPEAMRTVGQILERVTPLVVGQDPSGIERIWQDLFALTYT